jgi:hypothetical protein
MANASVIPLSVTYMRIVKGKAARVLNHVKSSVYLTNNQVQHSYILHTVWADRTAQ